MLKRNLTAIIALAALLIVGLETGAYAAGGAKKRTATFRVRIENISNAEGVAGVDGQKYAFALSPGLFYVNHKKTYFFDNGKKADAALEAQAEDGSPELLSKKLLTKVGSIYLGVFNVPVGAGMPAPILSGGAYEFTFTASEGMSLNLITMYGQSNDLFYAPKSALELFDQKGVPLTGDITDSLLLWDAGTERNQAPGFGDEQAPRQKMANSGMAESDVVSQVKDGFSYPNVKDVIKVTITAE